MLLLVIRATPFLEVWLLVISFPVILASLSAFTYQYDMFRLFGV